MPISATEILLTPDETDEAPSDLRSLSSAETAECTCPEWCERDHDRD